MTTTDAERYPSWWATDREHGPALLGLTFVRATAFIVEDPDEGWKFDFEGAWERGPRSHGERIIIALGWCLYNLGWAAAYDKEQAQLRPVGDLDGAEHGVLWMANPSDAASTLGDGWWATYTEMLELARRDR